MRETRKKTPGQQRSTSKIRTRGKSQKGQLKKEKSDISSSDNWGEEALTEEEQKTHKGAKDRKYGYPQRSKVAVAEGAFWSEAWGKDAKKTRPLRKVVGGVRGATPRKEKRVTFKLGEPPQKKNPSLTRIKNKNPSLEGRSSKKKENKKNKKHNCAA